MFKNIALGALLVVGLAACESEDKLIKQLTTQLGAAENHPCSEQFDYQFELNGMPDDTRQSSEEIDGETIITEQHWYADLEMILYYTYADGGYWCNNWNENGVTW